MSVKEEFLNKTRNFTANPKEVARKALDEAPDGADVIVFVVDGDEVQAGGLASNRGLVAISQTALYLAGAAPTDDKPKPTSH